MIFFFILHFSRHTNGRLSPHPPEYALDSAHNCFSDAKLVLLKNLRCLNHFLTGLTFAQNYQTLRDFLPTHGLRIRKMYKIPSLQSLQKIKPIILSLKFYPSCHCMSYINLVLSSRSKVTNKYQTPH